MKADRGAWNAQFLLEALDKADELGHLLVCEGPSVPISNKADPDRMPIVKVAFGPDDMSPWKLVVPTIPGVNLSISESIAISDQEVVAQPLVPEAQVLPVHRLRGAECRTQVVNDDSSPPPVVEWRCKIEERIMACRIDFIKVPEIRQWKTTRRHGSAVETQQSDRNAHSRDETRPDHLGPASDRWLRSGCRGEGCHRRVFVAPEPYISCTWFQFLEQKRREQVHKVRYRRELYEFRRIVRDRDDAEAPGSGSRTRPDPLSAVVRAELRRIPSTGDAATSLRRVVGSNLP